MASHWKVFAVTDRRVLIKDGVIRRHSVEILLEKVEGIGITQTIPGRLLNFGSIVITGIGGTRETFHEMSAPMEFRRQVQARVGTGPNNETNVWRVRPFAVACGRAAAPHNRI